MKKGDLSKLIVILAGCLALYVTWRLSSLSGQFLPRSGVVENPVATKKDASPSPTQSIKIEGEANEIHFEKVEIDGKSFGSGVRDPETFRLKELTLLYLCKLETTNKKPFQYLSASAVCDGYGASGVSTGLYLVKSLADDSFQPLYLCHTKNVRLYNTLNRLCDSPDDKINSLIGYVRK